MTTQTFRKKPIEIQATQWFQNGDHPDDNLPPKDKIVAGERTEGAVVRYFRHPHVPGEQACKHCGHTMHMHGWIDTLEGGHIVCPGDWIITGVQGERYPCKPDIFEATYAPADEPLAPVEPTPLELLKQATEHAPRVLPERIVKPLLSAMTFLAKEGHDSNHQWLAGRLARGVLAVSLDDQGDGEPAEVERLNAELRDARSWARHGYEIGQRSATWSDEGVAPKWLTEGHNPAALAAPESETFDQRVSVVQNQIGWAFNRLEDVERALATAGLMPTDQPHVETADPATPEDDGRIYEQPPVGSYLLRARAPGSWSVLRRPEGWVCTSASCHNCPMDWTEVLDFFGPIEKLRLVTIPARNRGVSG